MFFAIFSENDIIYTMDINQSLLRKIIVFTLFAEVLSLASFVFPMLGNVGFVIVAGAVLALSLKRLEWGLSIAFVELIIGSFGQMFSLNVGGFGLSVRIGIFLVIMSVWVMRYMGDVFKKQRRELLPKRLRYWYLGIGVVVLLGIMLGYIRNDLGNVFFDVNNWFYFLYVLPVAYVVHDIKKTESIIQKNIQIVYTLFTAGIVVLAAKTIILEYFFAHQIPGTVEMLYRWIRDYRFGEITFYAQNFYRVFLQSQIYLLFGFFIFVGTGFKPVPTDRQWFPRIILFLITVALIISFSRSLWVAWVVGTGIFGLVLLFKLKWPFLKMLKWMSGIVGMVILSIAFIFALINIPPVRTDAGLGSLLSDRVMVIEAAGSSRINLLQPLWEKTQEHLLLGSGFGTTVTYTSVDPRNLAATAGFSGAYTTYAFEWGYLDLLLKIGLVGTLVYISLLVYVLYQLYTQIELRITNYELRLALFVSLCALMVVHVFTPYLNHPLGIGFIVLTTGYVLLFTSPQSLKPNP